MSARASTDGLCCTFWVGGQHFGLDVAAVREILTGVSHTPVPCADDTVAGILNLRGEIVTVIDLQRRLRCAGAGAPAAVHIVVEAGETVFAVLVDGVGDVVDLSNTPLGPVPPTVEADIQQTITGVCTLEESILQVLDHDVLARSAEATAPAS